MPTLDWNLLPALEALLAERSVSRAAARVGMTVPSMSRALGRLRAQLGDPLLVRAGRLLVPTAHATELAARVATIAQEGRAILSPAALPSLESVERTLRIRANDGAFAAWAEPLSRAIRARAPRVKLAFLSEGDETPDALREGRVDLDLGVFDHATPELRSQVVVHDHFVGVVRRGHPLTRGRRTPARLAAFDHVGISRRGQFQGPIDVALAACGLTRSVVATVATAAAAAVIVARSDWVGAMPSVSARALAEVLPIATFELPLSLPSIDVAQTWHPRFDRDPAHGLLREAVRAIARATKAAATGAATRRARA